MNAGSGFGKTTEFPWNIVLSRTRWSDPRPVSFRQPAADYFAQLGEDLVHLPPLRWMMKLDWRLDGIVCLVTGH